MAMELHLPGRPWFGRTPDWVAAAIAGFAAGAVMMVIEMVWAASTGDFGPWRVAYLVAALVMGPGILHETVPAFHAGVVAVALITHYLLGIVFGLVLGAILARLHSAGRGGLMQETIGALFGAALYLLNFHGLSHLFPWFQELRGWATFIAHLVFGISAALLYWKLERSRTGEPRSG